MYTEDKNAIIEQRNKKLKELGSQIEHLQSKADTVKDALKKDYENTIRDLKNKQEAARESIQKMKDSAEDSWSSVKEKAEQKFADLKNAVHKATEQLKKQGG